jgi:uncharacterized membrane protein
MNLLLVLLLAACGGTDNANDHADAPAKADRAKARKRPAPKGEPINVKGTLDYHDDGTAVLKPCDGSDPLQLRVGSGDPARVRQELGESIDDVYVEMRGLKQDDGTVVIKAFDVAMVGFDGCANPMAGSLAAVGTDPAWKADVKDDTLTISAPDVEGVTFSGMHKTDVRTPITFEATGPEGTATLALKRARCKDAANSAFFPWAATVSVGGKTYKGCARGELPRPNKASQAEPEVAPDDETPEEQ